MKPTYLVWYRPYYNLNEIKCVVSYARNERDARWFARAFGTPVDLLEL